MQNTKCLPVFLEEGQHLVEIMASVIHVPVAVISRLSFPNIEIIWTNAGPGNPFRAGMVMRLASQYCEQVCKSGRSVLISDARASERWRDSPPAKYGFAAYLGYPIMNPDGSVFGTLCVFDAKENHFSPEDVRFMESLKALAEKHLSLWLQNQALKKHLQEIRTLRGILPICAKCKSIRNEQGLWEQIDHYIAARSDAAFSHGLCPKCVTELFPNVRSLAGPEDEGPVQNHTAIGS